MKTKSTKEDKSKKDVNGTIKYNAIESESENQLEIDVREDENEEVDNNIKQAQTKASKRPANDAEKNVNVGGPKKKIRHKSKPQIIDNMKEHVDNNTVDKLTTATLLHWLKKNSIYCTTRDKKADLMAKVQNHFADK